MIRNNATQRQVNAADPTQSTWLSANAGSGKTRVLTDRVARLLLDEVQPQNILCLTYTKAAASEMQNRLFKRLGAWSMLESEALAAELRELGFDGNIDEKLLRRARRLFARAIETPGGLKIQTIHSFCSSILRRFPLEAKVSPQFVEMDDRTAEILRTTILDDMASGDQIEVVDQLAQYFTGADFSDFTSDIVRLKSKLSSRPNDDDLRDLFCLPKGDLDDLVIKQAFSSVSTDIIDAAISVLSKKTKTMVSIAEVLKSVNWASPSQADFENICSCFLYVDRPEAKLTSIPSKAAVKEMGEDLTSEFQEFMVDIATAKNTQLAIHNYRKTKALYDFSGPFLNLYDTRKTLNGWLDFDDLILKARGLLTDPAVAEWVLYRLDGGIDHILVDEAQDTSPEQWDVIQLLAEEFTSGQGAHDQTIRTIFIVGDKKQSIYSFQGADPANFDRMKDLFSTKLEAINEQLQDLTLEFSFRSSKPVLTLVDRVFTDAHKEGVGNNVKHLAFHDKMPGRVDLWPIQPKSQQTDDVEWFEPLDTKSEQHHNVILAENLARQIRDMVDNEFIPDGSGRRRVTESDILILVQRRSDLFHELIQACKMQGLSIAGADRLKIGGELAVKDIVAVLEFLVLPEDDLALANALKSPIFGWNEQALFSLAHHRKKRYLWQALRSQPDKYETTLIILNDLRKRADFMRPFDLIERLLTHHKGRQNILARLGSEAQDGIDALLSQALVYERGNIPSLTGFLVWLKTDDIEIKRQIDSASNQIRVMTVHGAKGLEAPIVILPDTAKPKSRAGSSLIPSNDLVIWKADKKSSSFEVKELTDRQNELLLQERNRLLYVAMTRAEKWLIVCGAGDEKQLTDGWYGAVETALCDLKTYPIATPIGDGLRFGNNDWNMLPLTEKQTAEPDDGDIHNFDRVGHVSSRSKTISPSDLGGAKVLSGDAGLYEELATKRGRQIHTLLEHLPRYPETQWQKLAASLFSHGENSADVIEISDLVAEVGSLIKSPHLEFLFNGSALAEVPITANLPELGQQRIHGVVDRLVITDRSVTIVDFKSNAVTTDDPAQVPEGLLRQMGAYLSAVHQIYPNKDIKVAILWTKTGRFVEIPHDIVRSALQRATSS